MNRKKKNIKSKFSLIIPYKKSLEEKANLKLIVTLVYF